MNRADLRQQFSHLSVWQRGSERAPHKPLLVLWTLAQYASGADRLLKFAELEPAMQKLLKDFGPPRKTYHPEYPFWYLQNDGVWAVQPTEGLRVREGKATQPTRSELIRVDAVGGFTPRLFRAVVDDPQLLRDVAKDLLEAHFPESLHDDILQAVGLSLEYRTGVRRPRHPEFRTKVLLAYRSRCAVCEFDLRLGDVLVGVEAAHIKWHQATGPDTVQNGLALCSLHHKLFDRGAFTLTPQNLIEVSQHANGGGQAQMLLSQHHGQPLASPADPGARPHIEYVRWHRDEVFRKPGVYMKVVPAEPAER